MAKLNVDLDQINPVYRPYLSDEHRYQLFFGGSSSGKSCFLATRAVLDALAGRNILVVRKVQRTLGVSCWNEIQKAARRLGAARLFSVSRSGMTMTVRQTGAQILFAGLDDVEKIKSITPRNGVLTDIWIEEATECQREDFKQLDKRLRGPSPFRKRVTLSFNPTYRDHWICQDFFGGWAEADDAPKPGAVPGRSYADADVSILRTTYLDNRFLTDDDRKSLREEKNGYFHTVYTLGQWGARGGLIFTNWRVEDLTAHPPPGRLPVYFGLDFGFAQDPTACVQAALDREARRIYILATFSATGLVVWALAKRLQAFAGRERVVCDASDPRCIAELRELGVAAARARKGPDSVLHGIQWLQGYEIVVDTRCADMIRQLSAYSWKESADGIPPQPRAGDDHLIDALRYALEGEQTGRKARLWPRRAVKL